MTMKVINSCANIVDKVVISSPIGDISIESCNAGLHAIKWCNSLCTQNSIDDSIAVNIKNSSYNRDNEAINQTIEWMKTYFETPKTANATKTPNFCASLKYSEFYEKVWSTLRNEILFGCRVSYSELAEMCGNARASRAVGSAMKNNPFPLLVPCHRVIKKDGHNGNYSGGQRNAIKDWLLEYECDK